MTLNDLKLFSDFHRASTALYGVTRAAYDSRIHWAVLKHLIKHTPLTRRMHGPPRNYHNVLADIHDRLRKEVRKWVI